MNNLTHRETDPVSRQPALKASAVRLEPIKGRRRARGVEPRRLLVVGGGPAGVATAENVLANSAPGSWRVTLVAREPGLPYDRVSLSDRLAGHRSDASLNLRDRAWYAANDIELCCGEEMAEVDPYARVATTATGRELPYDALVLATGSQPLLPPIEGLDKDGVFSFRTRQDARAILEAARSVRRVAVIGGGLLGLEAARALAARGLEVTVIHLVDRIMERQLDATASRLLERALRRLGIRVLLQRATTEIVGGDRAEALRFAWDADLETEMVVISAGIRPDVSLADSMGAEVVRGIVVDDAMRTSVPGVWAVGECAEHRGQVHGLWGPILDQSRVAGASVAGLPAAFHGAIPVTRLKVAEIDLFCAGAHSVETDVEDEISSIDTRTGTYRKLIVRDDRLVGAILLGDTTLGPRLADLLRRGAPLPPTLLTASAPDDCEDEDTLVCSCMAVTQGQITEALRRHELDDVEAVRRATGAGGGCGTCSTAVASLLRRVNADR